MPREEMLSGVRVPQVFRLGCAAIALIVIMALTSIGVYSVVAGGFLFGGSAARASTGAPPVLVTIQAAPVTPTVLAVATSTPMPASLIPGLAQPAPSLAPPVAAPAPTDAQPAAGATAPPATPSPVVAETTAPAASPPVAAAVPASPAAAPLDAARQTIHDGVTLDIVGVERAWQPVGADGAPVRPRDGHELTAVLVRLVNGAGETRYAAETDFVLVGDDGSRYAPRQTVPIRGPQMLTVPVPARDTVRGWLTFETPVGATPKRLQWSPTRPDRPRAEATYLVPLP
jgi:hypothetical protein